MIVKRFRITMDFLRCLAKYVLYVREVLFVLLLLVAAGAIIISFAEGFAMGDALYFAFITALSIGYGDFHPATTIGKITSVGIGLVGMYFVGLSVAILTRALAESAKNQLEMK